MAYLDIPFNEKTYHMSNTGDPSDWAEHKPKMDFPNLPYIHDGTVKISESVAIMNYLAKKKNPGLVGKNIEE